MRPLILTVLLCARVLCVVSTLFEDVVWHPSWMPEREDLRCKSDCEKFNRGSLLAADIEALDDCCTCHSYSTSLSTAKQLYIEIVSIVGKNLVLSTDAVDEKANNSFEIVHANQELQVLPSNLCRWDFNTSIYHRFTPQFKEAEKFEADIVYIDFSNNEISNLPDMNCLTRLDTLDLSYNRITSLSNTTFSSLRNLRELFLQNNLIQHMDPGFISSPKLSLQTVNLGNNKLDQLDITNFFSLQPFCNIEYNKNNIKEFVNEQGFKLDTEKHLGPGFVGLKDNTIQTFPDFKELLHLDSLAEIGTLINFGFDLRGMPLICDCNLAPFIGLTKDTIESLWLDYMNITCDEPENMQNVSVKKFVNSTFQDTLTCNLECGSCTCTDQPSQNTLIVNCSGRGLNELPKELPVSKFSTNISLDLSNNDITSLTNVSYLQNVTNLNLANNNLVHIDREAAFILQQSNAKVDLGNNPNLDTLPPVLQYSSNVSLANVTLNCDCDATWIGHWNLTNTSMPQCRVPGHGVMAASAFSKELLDCDTSGNILVVLSVILSTAALALIIAGLVSYWFRYDILILMIRAKQANKNLICPALTYDVYLSLDEENDELRQWMNHTLVPYLEKAGYKLYVPLRDLQIGAIRDLSIIETLNKTKTFLLLLSESYTNTESSCWLEHEWKYGWNMYMADRTKNIVIINFDHLLTSETRHQQIKAFLRVGSPVEFTNANGNILQQICGKLGPPQARQKNVVVAWDNKNKKLNTDQLFLAKQYRQDKTAAETNNDKVRKHEKYLVERKYDADVIQEQEVEDMDNNDLEEIIAGIGVKTVLEASCVRATAQETRANRRFFKGSVTSSSELSEDRVKQDFESDSGIDGSRGSLVLGTRASRRNFKGSVNSSSDISEDSLKQDFESDSGLDTQSSSPSELADRITPTLVQEQSRPAFGVHKYYV